MHGLSTLNRLLGKKNKEGSRSSSNLSKSTNNLDTSSQHNKISPIVNNAPFEQTFRVTVYLPKNQLYVERIGAKTKLATLMERISENKHLTADKYEFRHPGDMSQVFDFEKTIGEVGLNELKLVLKTESRFNSDFHRFHPDDMIKYKTDSVSSSEISRNYSKNTMQKTSPYSSTTSLNSLDSTGMNLTAKTQPPVAPARKKRAAPRPPSQNSIPEQEIFGTTLNVFKEPHSILPRKNFHVSSPQLFKSDKNNNVETETRLNAITRPSSLFVGSATELSNGRQRSPSESSEVQHILHERQNSNSLEKKKKPAPVPPKRVHKPVPSPRTVQDDLKITDIKEIDEQEVAAVRTDEKLVADHNNVSKTMLNNIPPVEDHQSLETSVSDGPISIQIISSDNSIEPVSEESSKLPTVSKVHIKLDDERRSSSEDEMTVNIYNVTKSVVTLEKPNKVVEKSNQEEKREEVIFEKVKLRQTSPNAEEASRKFVEVVKKEFIVPMTVEGREEDEKTEKVSEKSVVVEVKKEIQENIDEPPQKPQRLFPEPIAVSSSSTSTFTETQINVVETTNLERPSKVIETHTEVTVTEVPIEKVERKIEVENKTEEIVKKIEEDQRPTSPLWTYTLPAPPVFADSSLVDPALTDRHKNGGFSDFASTDCNETVLSDSNTTVISAETHIQPIIVHRKSLDDSFNIASPVPDDDSDKSTEIITSDLEDGYLGNGKNVAKISGLSVKTPELPVTPELPKTPEPIMNIPEPVKKTPEPIKKPQELPVKHEIVIEDFKRSRLIITRSDSFHSIGQGRNFDVGAKRGPLSPQRSTSFLSLVQAQKAERIAERSDSAPYSRQKSSSELSISDTPSLQSLEVIKNILNSSRKNSLDVAEPVPAPVVGKKSEEEKRQPSEPVVEAKPAETQWRYSGPPKINLGTWSERPKVEVAIAADSDYKFGKVATRDYKNDVPVTTSKRHTIHISNERVETTEKHLPKVLGVEYKKDVSPAAEIVNKPTRTIINIKPRPMSMDVGNYSSITTSTGYNRNVTSPTSPSVNFNRPVTSPTAPAAPTAVSYNRLNTNVKKFAPVVRGFKMNEIKEGVDRPDAVVVAPVVERKVTMHQVTVPVEKKVSVPPSVPAKPTFLRSTSSGDINRNARFSFVETKVEDSSADLPFSQTTLRKTGLKDKILLSDKDTKSIFGRVVDSDEKKPVQLRETNREEHVEKVSIRQVSVPPPPKPPTAPPPMNFRKSAPVDMDTRNELLDAIKNFNRDSLRHK